MDEPIRCDWFPYCRCGMAIGTGRTETCFASLEMTFHEEPERSIVDEPLRKIGDSDSAGESRE